MKPTPPGDERPRRFDKDSPMLSGIDPSAAAVVAEAAGDLALLVDEGGVIRDLAASGSDFADAEQWLGQSWSSVVTEESKVKVEEMLAQDSGEVPRWRQINHHGTARELPLRFKALKLGNGTTIAVGRDERATARLQQRLLQVQQSLERDYLRLRQAESRYRLLFDLTVEPMLIVDAANLRIREYNPAAEELLAAANLPGQPLAAQVAMEDRDRLIAFLGAVSTGSPVAPITINLARSKSEILITARLFRQGGEGYYLVRLNREQAPLGESERLTLEMIDRLPDALVMTDASLVIVSVNPAFVDMVQAASASSLIGRPLGDLLGRPGIDLDLIRAQVAEHEVARNVSTILRGDDGGQEEVEVSAVRSGNNGAGNYAFTLRLVARRLRDLPPASRDLPRSVEQLTELVGRVPLKDIVRESTDLIERLCIEAALTYTSNNRASAAEILGLSRQSLYSKLNRHGLGRGEDSEVAE